MKRLALPLIAVGVLAACGGTEAGTALPATTTTAPDPGSAATQPPAAPSAEPASSLPGNVPEALKFAAPLVGGGDIELTTLAGRPVLLWFWAPW